MRQRHIVNSALLCFLLTCFVTLHSGCVLNRSTLSYTEAVTPPYLTRPAPASSASFVLAAGSTAPTVTRTTTIPTAPPATLPSSSAYQPPQVGRLRQVMLELINRDRAAVGLAPVQMDSLAAQVGQAHAEEMAAHLYMSHWNLKGWGPDLRYSIAGGHDAVMENVYMSWQRYSSGTPVPIDDWEQIVREAQSSLMTSPGHRANILEPEHTHVGIGIAYNWRTGDVRIAQEFVNHYIEMDPLPQTAAPGDTLTVSGRLLAGAAAPLVNLDYELIPRAMSVAELNATRTYISPAQFVTAIAPQTDARGRFTAAVPIGRDKPAGVYHVRVWVMFGNERILVADPVVFVGATVPN